jgi:conjugative coupling factor TraD (TOL family)
MNRYPLEALLRPPVELYSTLAASATGMIAILAPWAVILPPGLAYATASTLFALALWRGRQGWMVICYQHNLRRLRDYRLKTTRIPVSRTRLFLGRGFRWTQRHTQRLRDTRRPDAARYLAPSVIYRWARKLEHACEARPGLHIIARLLCHRAWWNPLQPLPPVGGLPALHGVESNEQDVWMALSERVGHTLVLGTTRVGKTRLAEVLITQDIRRGDCVIVFDPKGDADLLRRIYAEARRAGRGEDFMLFHLGFPAASVCYNAIGHFSRITEVATRIANQLPSEGNSAAFKEFAWRFVNIIARALVALGRRPDYTQVRRYINDIEPLFVEYARAHLAAHGPAGWEAALAAAGDQTKERNLPSALRGRNPKAIALARYLQEVDLYDPVLDGLASAFKYDKTYFDKIVSSVGPLMEKLTTGRIAELISPDLSNEADARPVLEWMDVIRRKRIVYVGLDALTDTTVASAVGNSMFADLVSVAGHLYKHGVTERTETGDVSTGPKPPPISLHADEFNEVIGEEFVPLLNKAGGAGFQVTAYTQTWSDVEARIGSRAKAGQVAGNFNTLIMLRVKELATAEMLINQLPKVDVHTLTSVSSVDDSSEPASGIDFRSKNEDRLSSTEVPLLTAADLVTLPKGQAFALLDGGQLWKIRMPLPDVADDRILPKDVEAIVQHKLQDYAAQKARAHNELLSPMQHG